MIQKCNFPSVKFGMVDFSLMIILPNLQKESDIVVYKSLKMKKKM